LLHRILLASILMVFLCIPREDATGNTIGLESYLAGATAILPDRRKAWNFNLGIGVGTAPEYLGSKDYEPVVLPLIDIDWRGRVFASTQRGLGFSFLRNNAGFRVGASLTYDQGRDSNNVNLPGLADIDSSFEAGLFFDNYSGPWRISGNVRKGLQSDGHNGIIGSLLVSFGGKLNQNANMILSASVTGGDSSYNSSYFSIDAYQAQAGLRDVGGQINLIYRFSERFYATIDAKTNLYMGDPGKSPIVQEDLPYFIGTVFGIRF
tara:strand:- start:1151 stop:1942 length:792 start_codon:yes stop_codon:yes gene_type:complete